MEIRDNNSRQEAKLLTLEEDQSEAKLSNLRLYVLSIFFCGDTPENMREPLIDLLCGNVESHIAINTASHEKE